MPGAVVGRRRRRRAGVHRHRPQGQKNPLCTLASVHSGRRHGRWCVVVVPLPAAAFAHPRAADPRVRPISFSTICNAYVHTTRATPNAPRLVRTSYGFIWGFYTYGKLHATPTGGQSVQSLITDTVHRSRIIRSYMKLGGVRAARVILYMSSASGANCGAACMSQQHIGRPLWRSRGMLVDAGRGH